MKEFFYRLAAIYGSAIILMFFSEYFFVNEEPVLELLGTLKSNPILALPAFISFATFYVVFTYPFLLLISYFNVSTLSGLLLGGAIFGWATEGLTIPIIYEAIPTSFIFPSIGWHALIDVFIGWYLMRMIMRRFGVLANVIMFVILGVLWGAWASWYWGSGADAMAPIIPEDFALLAIVSSSFLLIGLILADRFGKEKFNASKWEIGIIAIIYVIMFPIIAFPYLPLSALIFPIIGLVVFALWRSRNNKRGKEILAQLHQKHPKLSRYFILSLTPLSAIFIYSWFYETKAQVPTDIIVGFLLLTGFVWFIWALIMPFIARFNR